MAVFCKVFRSLSLVFSQDRRWDEVLSLYDYRTRYYDPYLGRFLRIDTIGLWGDANNMGNPYAFVGNNPWTHLDPYGESIWRKLWAARKIPTKATRAYKKTAVKDLWKKVERKDIVGQNADGIAMIGGRKVNVPSGAIPGTTHKHIGKKSGMVYDVPIGKEGFPDFSRYSKGKIDGSDGFRMTGDRDLDIAEATRAYEAKGKKVPDGYTWHHHENGETMELIPTELNAMSHTGGDAITRAAIERVGMSGGFLEGSKKVVGAIGVGFGSVFLTNTVQAEGLGQGSVGVVVDVLDTVDPGVQDVVAGLWWLGEKAKGGDFAVKAPALSDAHETWFGEGAE